MDLDYSNIIVDDDFHFLALIDWELAHTAPWQVNRYPWPFPLLCSDSEIKEILDDPTHLAHENVLKRNSIRKLYRQKFREAEIKLRGQGLVEGTFAEVLESPASRVRACFEELGKIPEHDLIYVRKMVRLAFGFDDEGTDQYLKDMQSRTSSSC